MSKSFWFNLFLVCIGIVVGSMVSELTAGIPALSWLSYGLDFGTRSPFILDLNVISLTFGLTLKITISTVICIVLSLILGRFIADK